MNVFNAAASGIISIAIVVLILDPYVRDGVVIKTGLICMAAGFGALALRLLFCGGPDNAEANARTLLLINAGLVIVAAGHLMRGKPGGSVARRATGRAQTGCRQ